MGASDGDRPSLAEAIDGLYAAFAGSPYRRDMRVCSHCAGADDVAALAGRVRDIAPAALDPYAWKAVTLWGDVDDFRRVLPRVLELVATGRSSVPLPVVASKLRGAEWRAWESDEQAAIVDFLGALWRTNLGRWPSAPDAVECIASLDMMVDDLQGYLEDWHLLLDTDAPERAAALRHLIGTIHRLGVAVEPGAIRRLLWSSGERATSSAMAVWLSGPTTVIELERATFDYAGDPLADAAVEALGRLAATAY